MLSFEQLPRAPEPLEPQKGSQMIYYRIFYGNRQRKSNQENKALQHTTGFCVYL